MSNSKATPCLSVCIPTFNRRQYIGEAICSILEQVDPEWSSAIEICISDNASTDGTEDLVAEIQKRTLVKINYSRNEKNIGADSNFLRVVSLASGEYCWFMGSDDIALPGSLNIIIQEIKSNHDIYICNRVDCDIDMNQVSQNHWLRKDVGERCFDLSDARDFKLYTGASLSIGALFSFISSNIFRRDKWNLVQVDPIFIGTAYAHVFILLSFVKSKCIVRYLPYHLVGSRGNNDSFSGVGITGRIERVMLDIRGYRLLAERIFKNNKIYHDLVLGVLYKERPALRTLAYLRINSDYKNWGEIKRECIKAGYSPVLLEILGYTQPILVAAKYLRDTFKQYIYD